MTKLTQQHVDSLVRAQTEYMKAYQSSMSAPYRRLFDSDMLRLEELKNLVMKMVYNPDFNYGPACDDS